MLTVGLGIELGYSSMSSQNARSYPLVAEMRSLLAEKHRMSAGLVDRAWATFGNQWADQFEDALSRLCPSATDRASAVSGYAAFATAMLRLQVRFEQTGSYRVKSYNDALAEVYHNDAYMQSNYLPGLFLSHYLWPHHYRQLQFFSFAFLDALALVGVREFTEVGVGTGIYSRVALQRLPMVIGRGVDISPASQCFAQRHVAAFALGDRYHVDVQNVVSEPTSAPSEALICVEVLEHLEDPVDFLRALRRMMKSGGKAFITAALNSAHADHIYLYRHAGEVEQHIVEAGFVTEQYFVGYPDGGTRAGVPRPHIAAFIVH